MQPRDPEFRYLSSREPLKCAQSLTQRGTPAEFFLVIHMFPSLPRFFVPSFTEVADSDGDGRFFFFADFAAALAGGRIKTPAKLRAGGGGGGAALKKYFPDS